MARQIALTIFATILTIAGVMLAHRQYVAPWLRQEINSIAIVKVEAAQVEKAVGAAVLPSQADKVKVFKIDTVKAVAAARVAPANDNLNSPAKAPLKFREPNTIYIDSLKITAPLVYITDTGETAFQAGLLNGAVHYPNTARPGEFGNVFIFGHSSDYYWSKGKYKQIFAPLPKITKREEIAVTDNVGKPYTYQVTEAFVAEANDVKYLDQYNFQKKLLTVQTSYPVGSAKKRFVVLAELVE